MSINWNDPAHTIEEVCNLEDTEVDVDYFQQAKDMLAGKSRLLPTLRHLESLDEHHQVALIKISNLMDDVKRIILEMP